MSDLLQGVALVTGAGSGIGQATAVSFARHGVEKLALLDINADGLSKTEVMISEVNPEIQVLSVKVDLADEAAIVEAVKNIVEKFQEIHILVNNVGFPGPINPSTEVSSGPFRQVLEVNVIGMWVTQREVINQMLRQKRRDTKFDVGTRGVIVNMSSIYGLIAPGSHTSACAYATSKHAVIGLTKTDANCFAKDGIRINAICPGFVNTAAMRQAVEAGNAMTAELVKIPIGRFAEPQELAEAISFLASPMSSYMSGSCLVVDGGYTCQ